MTAGSFAATRGVGPSSLPDRRTGQAPERALEGGPDFRCGRASTLAPHVHDLLDQVRPAHGDACGRLSTAAATGAVTDAATTAPPAPQHFMNSDHSADRR